MLVPKKGPLLVPETGPLLVPLFAAPCVRLLRGLSNKCANGARFWDQKRSHFWDQKWSRVWVPIPFQFVAPIWFLFLAPTRRAAAFRCDAALQRTAYRGFLQTHYPPGSCRPYLVRPPSRPSLAFESWRGWLVPIVWYQGRGHLPALRKDADSAEPGYVSLMGQTSLTSASFQHESSFTVYSLSIVPSGCGSGFGTISGPWKTACWFRESGAAGSMFLLWPPNYD